MPKIKHNRHYQEFVTLFPNCVFKTMPIGAVCYICKKGLENGQSITAKRISRGIVLLCDVHYAAN